MENTFLWELDRWLLVVLQEKLREMARGITPGEVTATDLSQMISDYVLHRLADTPTACWSTCGLDYATDEEILAVSTFTYELLAAGFIGAVCELNAWEGEDGVAFMIVHGVPREDAKEIAAAVEVVSEKLGARGQALIQRLTRHDSSVTAPFKR